MHQPNIGVMTHEFQFSQGAFKHVEKCFNFSTTFSTCTVVQSVSKNGVTHENVIKGVLTLLITHYKKN